MACSPSHPWAGEASDGGRHGRYPIHVDGYIAVRGVDAPGEGDQLGVGIDHLLPVDGDVLPRVGGQELWQEALKGLPFEIELVLRWRRDLDDHRLGDRLAHDGTSVGGDYILSGGRAAHNPCVQAHSPRAARTKATKFSTGVWRSTPWL